MAGSPMTGFSALDPCVHCGFCLQACPTYLVTGDEADSPRGRIVLMRVLERGEVAPDDDALNQHLDACLGCRACEPVCPSGVGYGRGLQAARELLARSRNPRPLTKAALAVFGRRGLGRMAFRAARVARDWGVMRRLAGPGRAGFAMAMVTATQPAHPARRPPTRVAAGTTVALFRGCIMDGLFAHIHEATRRTLEANGYRVVEVDQQVCCGALHEHAGDRAGAERLARRNLRAFAGAAEFIVVNSAGCGALLKDYGHLLETAEASRFAEQVRDVTELLAARGPRPGGSIPLDVAYDAPCHLAYAQRVLEPPRTVLEAVPGLRVVEFPGSDRCCGSAGLYSLVEPEMSRAVLGAKIAAYAAAIPAPAYVLTGNPGCLMQIGAGLMLAGLPARVAHPVEVLDWSYSAGGVYGA